MKYTFYSNWVIEVMDYGNFMRKFKVASKLPTYVLPGVFRFELHLTVFADKPVDVEGYLPAPNGYVRAGNHSATVCHTQSL